MRVGTSEESAAQPLSTPPLPESAHAGPVRGATSRRVGSVSPRASAWRLAGALLCGASLLAGCSKSGSHEHHRKHHVAPRGLAAYVLDKAPAISHPLDVRFDDRVFLLGYDLSPEGALTPGTPVTLTLYWRLDEELDGNWKLSSLVIDDHDKTVLDLYNASPIRAGRRGHPRFRPSRWSLGKVYVDKLSFKIPATTTAHHLRVIASVYSTSHDRMNVTRGESERPGYAPVTGFDIAIEKPTVSLPELEPGAKIAIDGKLSEPAWQKATKLAPLLHVRGNPNARPQGKVAISGQARLLWDAQALYVGYEIRDPNVLGEAKPPTVDPELSKGDAVALLVDPDGDGQADYQIQINPQNAVYDAQAVPTAGASSEGKKVTMQKSWRSRVTSAAVVNGTLNKPGDQDQGYVVEARIPWQSFGRARPKRPVAGDTWKLNVYAVRDGNAIGWAPLFGKEDFENAARFGTVELAERASAAPRPVASSAASAKATVAHAPATKAPQTDAKTASNVASEGVAKSP